MSKYFLIIIFSFYTISCAPNIGPVVSFPVLNLEEDLEAQRAFPKERYSINILSIADQRTNNNIVTIDDKRTSKGEGEVDNLIYDRLEFLLKDRGIAIDKDAPVGIELVLQEWDSVIKSGFGSEGKGNAKIRIDVIDPTNTKIYSGTFSGFSVFKLGGIGSEDVQDILREAMNQALIKIVDDKKINNILTSY